jgi:hypothetical protein
VTEGPARFAVDGIAYAAHPFEFIVGHGAAVERIEGLFELRGIGWSGHADIHRGLSQHEAIAIGRGGDLLAGRDALVTQ